MQRAAVRPARWRDSETLTFPRKREKSQLRDFVGCNRRSAFDGRMCARALGGAVGSRRPSDVSESDAGRQHSGKNLHPVPGLWPGTAVDCFDVETIFTHASFAFGSGCNFDFGIFAMWSAVWREMDGTAQV